MDSTADKVVALRAENPSISGSAMAVLLGVSRQRIAQILTILKMPTRIKRLSKPRKEWQCWWNMVDRCTNPNNRLWTYYGGRGIRVCARWRHSFSHFLEDMGPRPSPSHSIDRKNNDGDYTPKNCRWATKQEQRANQRPRKNDVLLGKEHRQIWFAATTNDEAAKKVSKLMGRKVSVQTLRRKFGPSGRTAGWPPKR